MENPEHQKICAKLLSSPHFSSLLRLNKKNIASKSLKVIDATSKLSKEELLKRLSDIQEARANDDKIKLKEIGDEIQLHEKIELHQLTPQEMKLLLEDVPELLSLDSKTRAQLFKEAIRAYIDENKDFTWLE